MRRCAWARVTLRQWPRYPHADWRGATSNTAVKQREALCRVFLLRVRAPPSIAAHTHRVSLSCSTGNAGWCVGACYNAVESDKALATFFTLTTLRTIIVGCSRVTVIVILSCGSGGSGRDTRSRTNTTAVISAPGLPGTSSR